MRSHRPFAMKGLSFEDSVFSSGQVKYLHLFQVARHLMQSAIVLITIADFRLRFMIKLSSMTSNFELA
eukprot:g70104.t1